MSDSMCRNRLQQGELRLELTDDSVSKGSLNTGHEETHGSGRRIQCMNQAPVGG